MFRRFDLLFRAVFAFFATVPVSAAVAAAAFFIVEALPNTADDALLEYVDIASDSCDPSSLSGYSLSDASLKSHAFGSGDVFAGTGVLRFSRTVTKITLNNENETLFLRGASGALADTFSYATSVKGLPVFRVPPVEYPACVPQAADSGSAPDVPDESSVPLETVPPDSVAEPPEAPPVVDSDAAAEPEIPSEPPEIPDAAEPAPEGLEDPDSEPDAETASGEVSDGAEGTEPQPVEAPAPSQSRASPEFLAVLDTDADGRFDRVDVTYSEAVTGSVSLSDLLLSSVTGGLFAEKVPTVPGYFSGASVSGSVLSLFLSGAVLPKASLRVDASTSSELRLKSSAEFGLLTLASGLPAVPLGLTTSFDAYSKDRISFFPPPPAPKPAVEYVSVSVPAQTVPTIEMPRPSAPPPAKKPTAKKSASPKSAKVAAKPEAVQKPAKGSDAEEAFRAAAVIPSAGVDLLPDGSYRYECFSKTSCPVSFRVENAPKGGYWRFADGRKRFGTSTSTLGTGIAHYRLAYALDSDGRTFEIPVRLSVVQAAAPDIPKPVTATVKAASKKVAASAPSVSKSTKAASKSPAKAKTSEKSGSGSSAKPSVAGASSRPAPPAEADAFPLALVAVSLVSFGLLAGTWIGRRLLSDGDPEVS